MTVTSTWKWIVSLLAIVGTIVVLTVFLQSTGYVLTSQSFSISPFFFSIQVYLVVFCFYFVMHLHLCGTGEAED